MSLDYCDSPIARPGKDDYPHLSEEKQKEELTSLLARSSHFKLVEIFEGEGHYGLQICLGSLELGFYHLCSPLGSRLVFCPRSVKIPALIFKILCGPSWIL